MRNIVNTCNIDTVYGNRTINLIREDIAETNDELIVFSTHALMDYPVDGEVYKALKKKYKVNYESKEEAVITHINGIIVQHWKEKDEDGYKNFLMARIKSYADVKDMVETHDINIRSIFACIRALEFNDVYFSSISFPIIGGNKRIDYFESIKIMLKYSLKYLKESRATNVINIHIISEEQEQQWSTAFEKTLGRTYYQQGSLAAIEPLIVNLKEIILTMFKEERFKELEFILNIIYRELEKVDAMSINNIAINSRKIVETIAKEIASRNQINIRKIKFDLSAILNLLATKDILAPWIIQYFHMARVFGNKSAHVETAIKYTPSRIYNSDFISILSTLYNILNFWYYNKEKI